MSTEKTSLQADECASGCSQGCEETDGNPGRSHDIDRYPTRKDWFAVARFAALAVVLFVALVLVIPMITRLQFMLDR